MEYIMETENGLKAALEAVVEERRYQDQKWPNGNDLSIGEELYLMQMHLRDAGDAWASETPPETEALDILRKVVAMGVRCMENNGVVFRDEPIKKKVHYIDVEGDVDMDKLVEAVRAYSDNQEIHNLSSAFDMDYDDVVDSVSSFDARDDVYAAIDTERDFQDKETAKSSRPDMIDDFDISAGLSAMKVNLDKAFDIWYHDSEPYADTMDILRKIAGICVKMGERYGMPYRESV